MTEGLIATAFALSGLVIVGLQADGAFGKLFLLMAMIGALVLHIMGRAVTAPQRLQAAIAEVIRAWWPLLLLSGFIFFGSLYARLIDDIRETFLGFALGMFFLPLVAVAVRSASRPFAFAKLLTVVYVATVLAMLLLLALGRGTFHEEIFLTVPAGAYWLTARPLKAWQALLGFALIGACLLSFKNTTFLMVLVTLSACAGVWVRRLVDARNPLWVATGAYFSLLLVAGVVGTLLVAYLRYKADLPSGNTEYRIEMYGIAWRRFFDSPLWGTGFTESAVTYFELYRVETPVQTLPTHSDVIDMLAHGGVIAISLWCVTVWRLLAIGFHSLRHVALGEAGPSPDRVVARRWRALFLLSLIQFSAIITYAVNPLLHRPAQGIWIWGGAGLMWALHRFLTDESRQTDDVVLRVPPRGALA